MMRNLSTLIRFLPLLALALASCLLAGTLFAADSDRSYENQGELPAHIQPTLSPPLSPESALQTFELDNRFEIDLLAAEPLIEDPILIEWDRKGRLWVCEMRGFMMDVNATGQFDETGRISVLEDSDGDGKMDKATHFLEGLVLPRAMRVFQEGLLVAEHDKLWFVTDPDDDLVPNEKIVVDAEYATNGSVEHRPNGLLIGLDNWIYNSRSNKRYKRVDGEWITDATENRGQWGISMDDYGRLFYNFHWSQLHSDIAPPNSLTRNPNITPTLSVNATVSNDQFVYPIRMTTSVNRGYRAGVLDDEGKLIRFASACSPTIYRGGTFPPSFNGNAFVCAPGANTIKRNLIVDRGIRVSAINAYPDRDFLASTDERFRPVSLSEGPTGDLYVVDMYRGVIQQADYITTYLRNDVIARNLEQPINYGRIYKIHAKGTSPNEPLDFHSLTSAEYVDLLKHSNGWIRDQAQQWLVWKNPEDAIEPLKALAQSKNARTALHALWTLEGMEQDSFQICLDQISIPHPKLSAAARLLAASQATDETRIRELVSTLEKQFPENETLSFHSLLALGQIKKTAGSDLALKIANRHIESPHIREALLSGLHTQENEFLNRLLQDPDWKTLSPGKELLVQSLAATSLRSKDTPSVAHLFQLAAGKTWIHQAIKEGLLLALLERETPLAFSKDPRLNDERFLPHIQWPGHDPTKKSESEARELSAQEKELYVRGQAIYGSLCASCHGSDGRGLKLFGPPLAKSEWVSGDPDRLAKILLHGLEGAVEVNGKTYAPPDILPAMPPVAMMSDTEIAATITFVRRSWGNGAEPVGRQDVTRVRDTNMTQMGAWTVEELTGRN